MKLFKYTVGADEMFVQTFAMKSPYASAIVENNLRYICWEGGNGLSPITLGSDDLSAAFLSGKLFARKFSMAKKADAVNKIIYFINESNVKEE